MKNIILLALAFFSLNSILADPPPPRDTMWFAWQSGLLHAPVITGGSTPIEIVPTREPFCFDKQISVKMTVGATSVNQCLYLDTRGGLIGHLKPKRSAGGDLCDIKPEEKDFSFFILGLKGNAYHYYTREGKPSEGLKKYVSTGNSDEYKVQIPDGTGTTAILHLKTDTRMYCDDKIKAKAYKFDGSSQVWYLFGREFPATLTWKKYIGNFGVGYLFTDKGLYMIMEMTAGTTSFKINSAEDVHVCFDPTQFQIIEDQFVAKRTLELQKEREKLDREAAKLGDGDCQGERSALYQFKVENLRQQEVNLQNSQVGNAYQDRSTQTSYLGMMDPLIMIRQGILETKVSICKSQINAAKHPGDSGAQDKVSCYSSFLGILQNYEGRMVALDARFATNPGQAYAEKSKLYMEVMRQACN